MSLRMLTYLHYQIYVHVHLNKSHEKASSRFCLLFSPKHTISRKEKMYLQDEVTNFPVAMHTAKSGIYMLKAINVTNHLITLMMNDTATNFVVSKTKHRLVYPNFLNI